MELLSQGTSDLSVGQVWTIMVDALSEPVVTITLPNATTVTPDVQTFYDSFDQAFYAIEYIPLVAGRFTASIAATDEGALVAQAFVLAAVGTPPTGAQLGAWMGGAGAHSYTEEDLDDAMAVALAAQRRVCRVPASYPADLAWAALRRGARTLYMKRQLTEQPRSEGADFDLPATFPPGRDQGIRELESSWRKLPIG